MNWYLIRDNEVQLLYIIVIFTVCALIALLLEVYIMFIICMLPVIVIKILLSIANIHCNKYSKNIRK